MSTKKGGEDGGGGGSSSSIGEVGQGSSNSGFTLCAAGVSEDEIVSKKANNVNSSGLNFGSGDALAKE